MKIICCKDEFAELIRNCEFNKANDTCEHCILYDGTDMQQCSAHLVSDCEIYPESGD